MIRTFSLLMWKTILSIACMAFSKGSYLKQYYMNFIQSVIRKFLCFMYNSVRNHYFHQIIFIEQVHHPMVKTLKRARMTFSNTAAILAMSFAFFAGHQSVNAQFWTENFGTDFGFCVSQGTLANGNNNGNGPWTVVNVGVNGGNANNWFMSATANGPNANNECVQSCITNPPLNNRTLHISQTLAGDADTGVNYYETGFTVVANTSRRAESPTINCTGQYTIEVDFDFIHQGSGTDRCLLQYFDGTTWATLTQLPNTTLNCGTQGQWNQFNISLPASANNNANVKIGFLWENNDDSVWSNAFLLSVAVDNLELSAGPPPVVPVADFDITGGPTTFCEGGCRTFTSTTTFDPDFSTGAANATYSWSFPGGTPNISSSQNPIICYDTPGVYSVTLTVTDNIGPSAPVTQSNILTVQDCGPVVDIEASLDIACANEQCITFTDLSTGNNVNAWLWTFASVDGVDVVQSTQQNPTVCLSNIGFYNVTLEASDNDGVEFETFLNYVEIIDCTGPEVDFTLNRLVICPGECIQLTDQSTSTFQIFAWNWDIPGGVAQGQEGTPGSSTLQNPLVCYQFPGTYSITLTAVDQEGPSAITKTIFITVDPCTGPPNVGIGSSATDICAGDCVDFFSETLGLAEEFLWVFQGVADPSDAVSTERDPAVICYSTPGVYNVTLTVSNSNNEVDSETFVAYITVSQCINPPVPRIDVSSNIVCAGECVTFSNESTGVGIDSLSWGFQGALITSSTEANPTVCYNTPGTFDVSLYVRGAGGDSLRIFNDVITVINTPECRPTIEVSAPDTICAGGCANFSGFFTKADSVKWTFIGGNPATSTAESPGLVCYSTPGTYTVIVEAYNPSGPASPEIFSIFVGERPPLDAGVDITINAGASATLVASLGENPPIGDFLWQPFELVDDFSAQTVHTSPDETTVYIVYYSEPGTCTAVDTVRIFVNFISAIGVPNAFSPNGDGVNDEVRVLGQGIAYMNFKIYNRYGQLVFETKSQEIGWDGTENGKLLNPATFVYVLEVTFAEGGAETYTGDITLVR